MRYQHPDLLEITTFLKGTIQSVCLDASLHSVDFGVHVVKKTENERWYRGYGSDQYVYYARQGPKAFLGGTFEVASEKDLEKYACHTWRSSKLIVPGF